MTRSRVPRPPPDLRNTVPVCLSSEETSPVAGEVAFWRGFIAWWAREHSEPVSELLSNLVYSPQAASLSD